MWPQKLCFMGDVLMFFYLFCWLLFISLLFLWVVISIVFFLCRFNICLIFKEQNNRNSGSNFQKITCSKTKYR